jgi:hypothetical protein
MVTSAQGLANWLQRHPPPGGGKAEQYTGSTVFEKIGGRTGIVFLANYWTRTTDRENARTGDHIDLWNGSRFTSLTSWVRVQWGISWDGVWSDYRRASTTVFWPLP